MLFKVTDAKGRGQNGGGCTYPLPDQLRRHIRFSSTCWQWVGATASKGYGRVKYAGRLEVAHRLVFATLRGAIPDGLVLDHLCRNRGCVNPDHLEPVTNRTNILRGQSPTALNALKKTCSRGHRFEGENLGWYRGGRICRECQRVKQRRLRSAKREGILPGLAERLPW